MLLLLKVKVVLSLHFIGQETNGEEDKLKNRREVRERALVNEEDFLV